MKKKCEFLIIILIFVLLSTFILNLKVTYYQGINYEVQLKKIPLYLKIIDLFSRHYHYRELVRELTSGFRNNEEKIIKLFEWTHKSIRKVPEGFPIVDDHVWHIIIRGYGTNDQSADVFATLCGYTGFNATWMKIWPKGVMIWHAITIVDYNGRKLVFDPYVGNYFRNRKDEIASIDDINKDPSLLQQVKEKPVLYGIPYVEFFNNLPPVGSLRWTKAIYQLPFKRITYELKRLMARWK